MANNMLSKAETIQAAKTEFCILIQNDNFYFYVLIPGNKILAFKKALAKGRINLKEFGKLLARGEGKPSARIKREMEFSYGCNHDDAVDIKTS